MPGNEQQDGWKEHDHEGLVHDHEHFHVTHNEKNGGFEHLSASHHHEHNHAPMRHGHVAHQDFEQEHQGEAHVHDHEVPTSSAKGR